jgi:hypothetical protein
MTEYVILLPGDESAWQRASEDERAATYDRHQRFMELLHERGHKILGGAELTHSREAKVVRGKLDDVAVSDGPYAETVEQISGFYSIETDDLDDLLKLCGLLAGDGAVEVRATVAPAGSEASS